MIQIQSPEFEWFSFTFSLNTFKHFFYCWGSFSWGGLAWAVIVTEHDDGHVCIQAEMIQFCGYYIKPSSRTNRLVTPQIDRYTTFPGKTNPVTVVQQIVLSRSDPSSFSVQDE